ncbi:hypothetical protein SprV_0301317200 [Sparganum proliferum]|nr:unnamed protein product [Spirometra erinaceieuropaei]VZI24370.1 unnamed protein product [Spirometra erinaceieuropaei]
MAANSAEFYTFSAENIDGEMVSMERYKGKVCLVFGHQEPGTNAEIKENALNKYHATFEFFSKCDVNGSNALPLFKYLQNALPGTLINSIKWNFTKFLIARDGTPYKRYSPQTDPVSIEPDIKHLLSSN